MNIPLAFQVIKDDKCVALIKLIQAGVTVSLSEYASNTGKAGGGHDSQALRLLDCGLLMKGYPDETKLRLNTIAFRELGNHIARMGIWQADAADDYPTPPMGIKRS